MPQQHSPPDSKGVPLCWILSSLGEGREAVRGTLRRSGRRNKPRVLRLRPALASQTPGTMKDHAAQCGAAAVALLRAAASLCIGACMRCRASSKSFCFSFQALENHRIVASTSFLRCVLRKFVHELPERIVIYGERQHPAARNCMLEPLQLTSPSIGLSSARMV